MNTATDYFVTRLAGTNVFFKKKFNQVSMNLVKKKKIAYS